MTVAVKNDNKQPLVVPSAVRRKARFKTGEELEFRVSAGVITIVPKPPTSDEHTPEQRRLIDARLEKSERDIIAGRMSGPFTAKQAAAFIEHLAKARARMPGKSNRVR